MQSGKGPLEPVAGSNPASQSSSIQLSGATGPPQAPPGPGMPAPRLGRLHRVNREPDQDLPRNRRQSGKVGVVPVFGPSLLRSHAPAGADMSLLQGNSLPNGDTVAVEGQPATIARREGAARGACIADSSLKIDKCRQTFG